MKEIFVAKEVNKVWNIYLKTEEDLKYICFAISEIVAIETILCLNSLRKGEDK